ncbi:polysaccharide biosynthesis tyrosine autokinase [Microvirga splendida]|nr:hypothetical protein [Microvirga splendida]
MKSNLIFKDGPAHQSALEPDCDVGGANTQFQKFSSKNHSSQVRSGRQWQRRKRVSVEEPILAATLSNLRGLFRRHTVLIVSIILLTSGIAGIGVSRMKTYYTATSSVILDQRDMRPLDNSAQRQSNLPPLNPDGEVELLKSSNVALRVVQRLRLMEDPEFVPPPGQLSKLISAIQAMFPVEPVEGEHAQSATAPSSMSPAAEQNIIGDEASDAVSNEATVALRNLISNTEIRRLGLSDIISIKAYALSPKRAAQIANAYAEAYLEEQMAPKLRGIERAERTLSRQLEQLDRELKRSEIQIGLRQLYQDTLLRLQGLSQQRYAVTPDARIGSLAPMPDATARTGLPLDKFVGMLGAILASFSLALGIAYVRDTHTRRVQTEEEIEKLSGVPNLASIPAIRTIGFLGGKDPVDEIVERRTSAYSDAIRRLYFNLQLLAEGKPQLGSLLVTSTEQSEGKTTLALSLARTAARGGARVLLIDCDIHNPNLHNLLGLHNEIGFVDLLTGICDERRIIQEDPKSSCAIMTSGDIRDIASEWLFQPNRLRSALLKLEEIFDLVILDAQAVKISADPLMLANCSTLTIFTVRAGWANPTDIQSSIHQLHSVKDSDFITVLTFV